MNIDIMEHPLLVEYGVGVNMLMSGQIEIMTRPIRLWSRPSPEYAWLVPTVCLYMYMYVVVL